MIPKSDHASRVDKYHPIALCNGIFKIVTKIIADRLKPLLEDIVHPNQSAFIPNWSIGDNTIIHHEVMYFLNSHKGVTGYMAIKINLAKA